MGELAAYVDDGCLEFKISIKLRRHSPSFPTRCTGNGRNYVIHCHEILLYSQPILNGILWSSCACPPAFETTKHLIYAEQTLTDLNDFLTPSQACIKPVEQVNEPQEIIEPGAATVRCAASCMSRIILSIDSRPKL